MKNISIIKDVEGNEFVIIDKGNEEFTSMSKLVYDTFSANSMDFSEAENPKK
jgi:hypothetical protein